jgi:cell division protein ZapA (FtsZ GTPase activity inhibitor)
MRIKIINDEQLQIEDLMICGRRLPRITITHDYKETFLKAVERLKKMLNQMQDKCKGNRDMDEQDFLLMIALQILAENFLLKSNTEFYDEKIQTMIDDLDNYLQN